jgi:probable rRNA maturation factor
VNTVNINAKEILLPSWSGNACQYALKVITELSRDNWELSILFCDDKTITELNSQYRSKTEATDVLSFPLGETIQEGEKNVYLPGDIVISLDTLHENAKYFQIPLGEELRRTIIHGILHLDGMDHGTNDEKEPMLAFQEEILNRLKNEKIIPAGGEK